MTAAADVSLSTNSDYRTITGTGAPWTNDQLFGVTTTADGLVASVSGVYKLETWLDLSQFPTTAAKIGLKYIIDGTVYGARRAVVSSNDTGDAGLINMFAIVPITAGSVIRLAVASTAAGNITFHSGTFMINLLRVTL